MASEAEASEAEVLLVVGSNDLNFFIVKKEFKFFSKKLLKEANEASHREKRSRCIDNEIIVNLKNDEIFFIQQFIFHKKNELRLFVNLDKENPEKFHLLDISVTRYLSLPYIEENSLGDLNFKFLTDHFLTFVNGKKLKQNNLLEDRISLGK